MGDRIMATTINADTSDGLKFTSDTSGELKLQSGNTDIATVSSTGLAMATGKTITSDAINASGDLELQSAGTTIATVSNTGITMASGKDLTASGIYLGGTASDNLLNDYEAGTWTPVLGGSVDQGTFTPDSTGYGGFYVKVGRLVTLFANCRGTVSGASGTAIVTGLPFVRASGTVANGQNATYSAMCISYWTGITVDAGGFLVHPSSYLYSHTRNDTSTSSAAVVINNASNNIHFSGSYYTD